MFELCTFQKPFIAEHMDELKEKILKDKYRDPSEFNLTIPKELNDIIRKILRKNPLLRPTIKEIL